MTVGFVIYRKDMIEHAKTCCEVTMSDLAKVASSLITRVKWTLLEWEVDRLVKASR